MRELTAALRAKACETLDGLVGLAPAPRHPQRLLVVRLDAVGDFIVWLREARHLRALYPSHHIVLAANALWAPLAEKLPYWDRVIAIDLQRLRQLPGYRARTLLMLRREGATVAIQPTYSRTIYRGDAMVRVSGATERIGMRGDPESMSEAQRRRADAWYTQIIDTGTMEVSEVERNHRFVRALGQSGERLEPYRLPTVGSRPAALPEDGPYFVVFPGAGWSGRQWPTVNFGTIVRQVVSDHGWLPVLCGSAADRGLCAAVLQAAGTPGINLAGSTSLGDLCETIRGARFLVGNETSAVHIAAAVDTPSVCVVGGGHFRRFVPYPEDFPGVAPVPVFTPMPCFGCQWRCTLPHDAGEAVPCISAVAPAAVRAAIVSALGAGKSIAAINAGR